MNTIDWAERGWLPDGLIRIGIRRLLSARVASNADDERRGLSAKQVEDDFARELRAQPIAVHTDDANQQHYQVPAEFFELMLGPHWKYSCGWWPRDTMTLEESEREMLAITCERAELRDGMKVLDLGCGWGSLSLFMAETYPASDIVALSNSATQRQSIEHRAATRGIMNLRVVTANVAEFESSESFDRIVSIEMFEHMRNYEQLLKKVASWMHNNGKLFVHIFCHRDRPYSFETDGDNDWMARHFFTGGQMPSRELFAQFQDDVRLEASWSVNGLHYARTCRAWLERLDANTVAARSILATELSGVSAALQLRRWRIFLMACEELFRYAGGVEWMVAQYRWKKSG